MKDMVGCIKNLEKLKQKRTYIHEQILKNDLFVFDDLYHIIKIILEDDKYSIFNFFVRIH
jgi:hypothetical protein